MFSYLHLFVTALNRVACFEIRRDAERVEEEMKEGDCGAAGYAGWALSLAFAPRGFSRKVLTPPPTPTAVRVADAVMSRITVFVLTNVC